MSEALALLVDLLDLERIEVNTFRGRHPEEERQRTFGGQVAAQALMAAGRTVEVGRVHSLHSYFLRPGDPKIPILYEVDRIRDGRSFITRRVVAIQHGRAIYNMQASFHVDEEGIEHQFEMPVVAGPQSIGRLADRIKDEGGNIEEWFSRQSPDRSTLRRRVAVGPRSQQGTSTTGVDQGRRRVARGPAAARVRHHLRQ